MNIDYELRDMFLPNINNIPLASSFSEERRLFGNVGFSNVSGFSNAIGDEISAKQSQITRLQLLLGSQLDTEATRVGLINSAQIDYDIVNAIRNPNRAEKKLIKKHADTIGFHNSKLAVLRPEMVTTKGNLATAENELKVLLSQKATEDQQLAQQKAVEAQQKATEDQAKIDLIRTTAEAEARRLLALKGQTPESVAQAQEILADAQIKIDEIKSAEVVGSNRSKMVLIIGGLAVAGLVAVLLLKRD